MDFEAWGYTTNKPCEVCGERPAKIEPRFGYASCEIHAKLPPIQFQREVDKRNDISKIYSPISNFDCT